MAIINSNLGCGALTKLFHWLIVFLFAAQYLRANQPGIAVSMSGSCPRVNGFCIDRLARGHKHPDDKPRPSTMAVLRSSTGSL
jgi:hypothetical protein